jgi:actin-related protein
VQEEGLLALFATGRTTGLSVTVSEGSTTATAVYEGYLLRHATTRADVGGMDVTERLVRLLGEQGVRLTTGAEIEIARYDMICT